MPDTLRHLFHGHAAVLSGRIVRVGEGKQAKFIKDAFIDVPAAALPVSGGRSTAKVSSKQLSHAVVRSFVRFTSATASSEGVFDDARAHFAATLGKRHHSTLATTTTVSAEVRGLDVGLKGNVRMLIKRVCGGFTAQKGDATGDMAIRLSRETGFDGNSVTFVDGKGKRYVLTVGIERDVFSGHDTFSRITAAAGNKSFLRKFGHVLHSSRASPGSKAAAVPAPPARTKEGAMQGTVVKPLKWKGPEFPGSTIDPERRNTLSVPGFGRVSFGEIMLAPESRRLTMVRITLGSPIGGDFACADVMDNGSPSL
jgi:hypothetical protein